ncbi:MAG: cell division protein ZapA [Rhodospirillales bacterium]|nr:cell division protein ZapA [Rhodospirillales bacterium]
MGQVAVDINGRKYQIACDDGQEAHLKRLGACIDKRIGELVASVGQIDDARLLVMVSLLVADELSDAYGELERLRKVETATAARVQLENALGERLDELTQRIEDVAVRFERP